MSDLVGNSEDPFSCDVALIHPLAHLCEVKQKLYQLHTRLTLYIHRALQYDSKSGCPYELSWRRCEMSWLHAENSWWTGKSVTKIFSVTNRG